MHQFIALNVYTGMNKIINNLRVHLRKPKKEEKFKSKNRREEIIKFQQASKKLKIGNQQRK